MKVKDLVSRVRHIAGDELGVQYPDVMLAEWINDAMRECVVDNLLLQKTGTLNSIVGTAEYDLPADVLKLYSVRYDGNKLNVLTLEEFNEQYTTDGTETGTPSVVMVWAGKLSFYPAPDAVKTIRIDYSYSPTEVGITGNDFTDETLELPLPAMYHIRIMDYCLAMVAQQDDDMNRYQIKMQEFRSGVQNLKDHPESTHDLYPTISVESRDMGDGWWD